MCQLAGMAFVRICDESRPIARQLEAVASEVNVRAGLLRAR
jgi:hypothetical protein